MNQLNASLRMVFHDLVERRLWPVALALAIALIAIPVLLSSSASEGPGATTTPGPAAPAGGTGSSLPAFRPVVSTRQGPESSDIGRSLKAFDSKDPFKVHELSTGKIAGQGGDTTVVTGAAAGDAGTSAGSDSSPAPGSGSGTSGAGTTDSSGESQGHSEGSSGSTPTYFTYAVDVRFGKADNLDKKNLNPFRALPSSQNPVVVFMGVKTDGKTAVFLVSEGSGTTGEGNCEPDDTCTFLYMKAGQQQSFESVDSNGEVVTFVLKLLEIKIEDTKPPSSSATASRAARRAERARRAHTREGFAARIGAIGF